MLVVVNKRKIEKICLFPQRLFLHSPKVRMTLTFFFSEKEEQEIKIKDHMTYQV